MYNKRPFNELTDSHETCESIAETLGRTPASVDRQVRNLKSAAIGEEETYNVGELASQVASKYVNQHQKSYDRAKEILGDDTWRALADG